MIIDNNDIFIFIGPPGAGKCTLAALCVAEFDWVPLSTGNLCRKNIFEQTPLGKQVESAIKSGKLVEDSLITEMVEQWLIGRPQENRSVILDGYPRSVGQAHAFEKILNERCSGQKVYVVLFSIPLDMLITRLQSRLMCQNKDCQMVYSSMEGALNQANEMMMCQKCGSPLGRREDDKESAVVARLEQYPEHTQPLIQFYKDKKYPFIELHADARLDKVFEEFKRKIVAEMV
jgi:adenylate kinase